jgi:hypothetical protein
MKVMKSRTEKNAIVFLLFISITSTLLLMINLLYVMVVSYNGSGKYDQSSWDLFMKIIFRTFIGFLIILIKNNILFVFMRNILKVFWGIYNAENVITFQKYFIYFEFLSLFIWDVFLLFYFFN